MGCGWCGDGCTRRHECAGPWVQDSCPPVLTDVGLRRRLPRSPHLPSTQMGREVANGVALGGTFALSRDPLPRMGVVPPGKGAFRTHNCHRAFGAQGDTGASPSVPPPECPAAGPDAGDALRHDIPLPLGPLPPPQPPRCLPGDGGPARLHRAAGGEQEPQVRSSARDGGKQQQRRVWGCPPPPQPGADPPSSPHRPLPTSRRKDFVDVLVCELEPGGPTAAGGPADVVLTVEEPTGPSSFRVHGSATLGGFVFVVWPCAGGLGFGGGFSSPTHATDTISAQEPHISALHPPFGPRGGGTHLSLRGTHLSAGSSWRVMVNGSECPLVGQPRYAPALPPLGTAGSLARGRAQGPPPPSPPATAAVSPGRARRQFGARLPPPVAWAQPRWPCGSTGRSSWPLCPSSTAPTPSFRPSIPAAAMSECVGSLPMGGTALASPPPRPGWTRC